MVALEREATRRDGGKARLITSIAATRGRIAEIERQAVQIDRNLASEVANGHASRGANPNHGSQGAVLSDQAAPRSVPALNALGIGHQIIRKHVIRSRAGHAHRLVEPGHAFVVRRARHEPDAVIVHQELAQALQHAVVPGCPRRSVPPRFALSGWGQRTAIWPSLVLRMASYRMNRAHAAMA